MLDGISDAGLLSFCAASYAGFGAFLSAAPSAAHDLHIADKGGPKNELTMRYTGLPLALVGAQTMVASAGSSKTQKAALKVVGFGAAANVGVNIYSIRKGYLKKDEAVVASVILGTLSALCLAKGFQEPKEDEPKSSAVAAAPKGKSK